MRISSGPRKFTTTAVISLSTALVLTSCSGDGDSDSGGEVPQEDIDRLSTALAETNELAIELDLITSRISRQCLEDEGFMEHPSPLQPPRGGILQALPGSEVPDQYLLPETEVATTEGAGLHEEWVYAQSEDYENPHMSSNPEWRDAGSEYRDTYLDAKHRVNIEELSNLDEGLRDELLPDGYEPEVGGCRGWANLLVYGSDTTELSDVDPNELEFDGLPPLPEDLNLDPWMIEFHTPKLVETKNEFNSCLEARGADAVSHVSAIDAFVRSFYEDHPDPDVYWDLTQGDEDGFIERPADAPWEFDEAKEQEIAYITDVAECADETDLRETRQAEWDQTLASMVIDHEEEMYAWEEQVRVAIEEAQELLAE